MASFLLLPSPCSILLKSGDSRAGISNSGSLFTKCARFSVVSARTSASVDSDSDSGNGAIETPNPRRGRKKKVIPASEEKKVVSPPKTKVISPPKTEVVSQPKGKRGRKKKIQISSIEAITTENPPNVDEDGELWDYDDGMDIPYPDPPLVCCFGVAKKEFVPTIRVHDDQLHPDKMLPKFARARGGPACSVAIAHVRLGGRAEFMGKIGIDELGIDLLKILSSERVQSRAVKLDHNSKTAFTYMNFKFEDGRMKAESVKEAPEDSLRSSELYLATLKEARIFHFSSDILTIPSMKSALFKAIAWSKKFGGLTFFDLNLLLPLWKSRDETREIIDQAWKEANIIEITRQELDFLLWEDQEQMKGKKECYHFTREDLAPLWHEGIKFLFVTDGAHRIHYYTPSFDGVVAELEAEDALITSETYERTGSGYGIAAAIMRILTTQPEIFENQDVLERQLRLVIAAGIMEQCTIGSIQSLPRTITNRLGGTIRELQNEQLAPCTYD